MSGKKEQAPCSKVRTRWRHWEECQGGRGEKRKKWDLSGDKARSGGACKPDEKLFFIVGSQESLSSDYHQDLYLRFPEGLYEDTLNIKTEKKRLENRVGSRGYWSPSIGEGKEGSERDWEEQESHCPSTDLSPVSHQRWLWNGDRELGYSSMIDGMLRTCQGCGEKGWTKMENGILFLFQILLSPLLLGTLEKPYDPTKQFETGLSNQILTSSDKKVTGRSQKFPLQNQNLMNQYNARIKPAQQTILSLG